MCPVISFINMKGGVGKTTLCIGMADYLASMEDKKVLVIDIDPQFNATQSLFNKYKEGDFYVEELLKKEKTIRKVFKLISSITSDLSEDNVSADEIIYELTDNLHIIPGDLNTIFDTGNDGPRIYRLKNFIEREKIKEKYDYVFIDSPPTISIFTDSSLVASDYYLVPMRIDHYSILGATSLIKAVERLKINYGTNVSHLGYVYTFVHHDSSVKAMRLKKRIESIYPFSSMKIFDSLMAYHKSLSVGSSGNIPTQYSSPRGNIEDICHELVMEIRERKGD